VGRWSGATSPNHITGPPASIALVGTLRNRCSVAEGTVSASVWFGCGWSVRSRTRGIGQPSSYRHSPGASSRTGPGGCQRRTKTAKRGSSMIPVSRPFSQWSNQRTASWRHSIRGLG
jgi:hypothetical protein